jgi:C4-dicarboxylate-specific signal transduction histidine kinase
MIADPEGRLVDLNPAARALLVDELALKEVQLDEVIARIAPDHGADIAREIRAAEGVGRGELRAGDGRRYRLQAARVAGKDGASAGSFAVLHDRSDEVRAERALRQAQRLDSVGMLAAGVAHELNNPLAFVSANLGHLSTAAEIAKRCGAADPRESALLDEAPSVLAETRQGIERIADIVSGLQRLSRNVDPGQEQLDLHVVVDEAVRMASLSPDDCRVELDLAHSLPAVRGSRGELLQVLLNLLVNAKQAVAEQEGGTLLVSTRAEGGFVQVAVEDNGPGVPEDCIEKIFDPFFTTKAPDQGSGLGLSIAYDLVRDHGGTLEAEGSKLGGARFVIRLPVSR